MKLLVFLTLLSLSVRASLYQQIRSNNSSISESYAKKIVVQLQSVQAEFNINPYILSAMFMVESAYRLDAVNGVSGDYGIGQVNKVNVRKYNLSAYRLLHNLKYSVHWSAFIFNWFNVTYDLKEAIMRYNCGTRRKCVKYPQVRRYLRLVRKYLPDDKKFLLN